MLFQAIIFIFASTLMTQATQSFRNTGTKSGWDSFSIEHSGTVQEVTDVTYEGPSAIKATQTYDPNYSGRYHSEAVHNNGYKLGDTGFYGFTFRLQQDWQFSPSQSYNLAQFIADFSDYKSSCDDWIPTSMVWIVGDQLYSRVKTWDDICHQHVNTFANLAQVSAGVWHKVEIQASWKADSTGYYKLWFDGNLVVSKYNIPTTLNDPRTIGFHVGLYANGWHDDKQLKGTQGTRQVWYDEIAMGTMFADADPAQWSK
jgi:hypothetical protein